MVIFNWISRLFDFSNSDEPNAGLNGVEFSVPKMNCEGCAEKITTALSAVPGIRGIKTKVSQKRVYIQYESSKIQEIEIRQFLDRAGFSTEAG